MIGFSPRQVDALTMWEFLSAVAGWRAANCPDEGPPAPTAQEHDALIEKYRDVTW